MTTLLGTTLNGRYRLEARIGAGGMSTVYRALDETLQRQVAIKLMNREVTSDSDQLERFRREARAVAQLSHPHIVGVIDAGEDEGRPYIVFEYVEGETLKERIRRNGRLPIAEAVAYAIEIARALGAAHARHIVHRDVKPQNVLIDEEGSAKVTDFGIARTLDEEGLTADGRVLGTTDYVSPEQALGQQVTGQSDLYSLGIVLYEMVTGEVPFKGENQVAVAMKHVREEIPDVQVRRPEVSSALAAVIDTATAKRRQDRYADDAELIADLEDVLAIETARAGGATGEATSVLRTLPSRAQAPDPVPDAPPGGGGDPAAGGCGGGRGRRRVAGHPHPSRDRQPERQGADLLLDERPGAEAGTAVPELRVRLQPPRQPSERAPRGEPGDRQPARHGLDYPDLLQRRRLNKAGVGLYVDARPMTTARVLRIFTTTPGFTAHDLRAQGPAAADLARQRLDEGLGSDRGLPQAGHPADAARTRSTGSTSCGSRASGAIRAWRWMR